MNIIEKARQVLKTEIEGIQAISDQLDENFENLVDLCSSTLASNGKLVLCGIGKSGQIAQKLASTLSSTGSRATFLHPVEALHGDLGIIHPEDIIIALSYSGETDELLTMLPAVKRLGNKVAAMTGYKDSSLGKMADLTVQTRIEQEACPFNLAPTTTTTAMLALGDALAIILMELTRFDIESYGFLHPSGAIGRSVTLRVDEVMRTGDRLAVVTPGTKVRDAIVSMCQSKGGTVLIADAEGLLQGIFTTGDLKRFVTKDLDFLSRNIEEVMKKDPVTVEDTELAVSLLKILRVKNINAVPVVDKAGLVRGVIDIQDLPKFKILDL